MIMFSRAKADLDEKQKLLEDSLKVIIIFKSLSLNFGHLCGIVY